MMIGNRSTKTNFAEKKLIILYIAEYYKASRIEGHCHDSQILTMFGYLSAIYYINNIYWKLIKFEWHWSELFDILLI